MIRYAAKPQIANVCLQLALSISKFRRFLIAAQTREPAAPMAAASVGEAKPMKIVPKIEKIRVNGSASSRRALALILVQTGSSVSMAGA